MFAAGEDTALAPLTTGLNKELSRPDADHTNFIASLPQVFAAGEDTALAPFTATAQLFLSLPQVFAAGEDTALAPLTTGLNKELSKPDADHQKVLRKYGKRYLTRMRRLVPKQQWPEGTGT